MTREYETPLYAEDVAVGDDGPTVAETLDRKSFVEYAGASGGFDRIHYDDAYVREAGNPSVFAQGMLTAGVVSHQVSDWLGLANVRTFSTRFVARVWPGDTVTATGEVVGKTRTDAGAMVEADLEATTSEGRTVVVGAASASLPSRESGSDR